MNRLEKEKIATLSTFFLSIPAMSSRSTKKSASSTGTNILAKRGKPVESLKKSKKNIQLSDSESSSSESESESSSSESDPKPLKKSKSKSKSKSDKRIESPKKSKKSKSDKRVELSSAEDSSDDSGVPLETIHEKSTVAIPKIADVNTDAISKVADGLLAIANEMAVTNEANAAILALLTSFITKLDERERINEMQQHITTAVEDLRDIDLGSGNITPHHSGAPAGMYSKFDDFKKTNEAVDEDPKEV